MRTVRQTFRIAFLLLTTAAVVVGGLPHYRCVCANGRVKPFCLSLASGQSGCCCGGTCCSADQGGCCRRPSGGPGASAESKVRHCCGQDHVARTQPPNCTDQCLQGTGCRKTPTVQEYLVSASERPAGRECNGAPSLCLPPPYVLLAAPSVTRHMGWTSHDLPPPTNRVIAFQHLVI
jgi:hypothetical protein